MSIQTNNKTILIVEDEVSLQNALHDKLVHEGFSILKAKDGEVGLEVASREHPDLILLDLIMPKVDGMTMLKKLRAKDDWGNSVPVIILTNLTSADEDRNRAITELEPTYYLMKADWSIGSIVEKIKDRLGMLNNS